MHARTNTDRERRRHRQKLIKTGLKDKNNVRGNSENKIIIYKWKLSWGIRDTHRIIICSLKQEIIRKEVALSITLSPVCVYELFTFYRRIDTGFARYYSSPLLWSHQIHFWILVTMYYSAQQRRCSLQVSSESKAVGFLKWKKYKYIYDPYKSLQNPVVKNSSEQKL